MFMYKDKTPVAKKEGDEKAKSEDFDIFSYIGIGELLLLLSLTCDGLTGAVQVCFFLIQSREELTLTLIIKNSQEANYFL